MHTIDPDVVFWTGDSSRHDRDPDLPRSALDVTQGIQKVATLINSSFRAGTVFPVVGNWDTRYPQQTELEDYQSLFTVWSILWTESQKLAIQTTFLEGGFYSVAITERLSVIALNTIDWYVENSLGDCKSNNQQLMWLGSILEEIRQLHGQVVLIGHVPPLSYLSHPLYHPKCLASFTNIIGEYSDIIMNQYYGHVNRDVTYLTTKTPEGSYQIVPLNEETLKDPASIHLQVVGTLHTGPSIVPYYYPAFRWGLLGREKGTGNSSWRVEEHVQYFAPIDLYKSVQDDPGPDFFRESCSSRAMSLNTVSALEWKALLGTIQHELKISGHSTLLQFYWDCSVVHWSAQAPRLPELAESRTSSLLASSVYLMASLLVISAVLYIRLAVSSVAGLTILNIKTGDRKDISTDEPVLDFAFNPIKKSKGFAVSKKSLLEWNLEKSKIKRELKLKQNLGKIAINQDGSLIAVAGTSIDIIDVKSWSVIKNFSGHATEIIGLVFGKQDLVYSCAKEDRFISRWSLDDDELMVYVVDSPPLSLSVDDHLLALLENGKAALWDISIPKTPKGYVELSAQDSPQITGFQSAVLAQDGNSMIVSYGLQLRPQIEKVSFLSSDNQIKSHIVLTRFLQEDVQPKKKAKSNKKAQIVGPNDIHQPDVAAGPKILEEVSLEDQVKALLVDAPVEEKQASQTSVQALLTQAIHSGDVQLLEKALAVSDRKIIHATIRKMSSPHVLQLLDQLVVRLQKRPNRAGSLVEWIRASLLHHSGYLLSVPHLTQRLGSLYRTLNARHDALTRLMRLSGRLDMISSQMDVFPLENEDEEETVVVFDVDGQNGNDSDVEIFIWDLNQLNKPYAPGARSQRLEDVTCLAWNKEVPHILASGSSNGYTVVWDLRNRKELIKIPYPGGRKPVTCVAWNPDKTFSGHSKGILSMDWCPKDSELLLSCGKDNRTIVWDTNSGERIGDLAHSANWSFDTKWCPRNPDLCIVASFDGKVTLHSIQGASGHPEEDVFSPMPAHAEPHHVDPNDPFAQIGVQDHTLREVTQPVFSLPHPPKWLRRPVGAVWGFGGNIATFDAAHGSVVTVKPVPISEEIAFRAEQLDYILKENNPDTSAQYCDYMATSDFVHSEQERDSWKFLKRLFSPSSREDMTDFTGYDQSFAADESLSRLVKKLHIHPLAAPNGHIADEHHDAEPQKTSEPAAPFSFYSAKHTEDTDTDAIITKAVVVGDFELAVSVCLGAGRYADALALASSGSAELLEKAQNEYFKKFAATKSYVRILQAVVKGELTDVISSARLDSPSGWKDIIALICTYSKPEDFHAYFAMLGDRLADPSFSGIKDASTKHHAAALCFMGAGDIEKLVSIWCMGLPANFSLSDIKLQSLVERLTLFRQAINYQDPSLVLESEPEEGTALHAMYNSYVSYAWTASVQGKQDVAWRFLELVPLHFIPDASIDIAILRDRVYANRGHVLAATGQPPLFPFDALDVVNVEAQKREAELEKQRQAHMHSFSSHQPGYGNQPQPWGNAPPAPTWNNAPHPTGNQWQPQQPAAPPTTTQWQPQPAPPTTNQWQPQLGAPPTANHSTGHAAPMPASHFQPPPIPTAHPQPHLGLANSAVPPPPIPTEPQHARHDRAQITAPAEKACYDSLCKMLAVAKAKSTDKKTIDEAEKKLEMLFDQMSAKAVSPPIISELQAICHGMSSRIGSL
ncbi:protein transport protein S31 [Kappamyces sp. JEL0680]|nr:protein transport protein S31 [Kappamyces sp. JEL0680]